MTLRQIEHAQCLQPPTLPRPDLDNLGISYRRIPLLSHGASVYCDTRLIIQKLESQFPNSGLAATSSEDEATSRLLESWTIDGGIFARAAQALPAELPMMKDPKFTTDREAYTGRSWSQESVKAIRPEALVHLREAFDFVENVLLVDGRPWVLKSGKPEQAPSLADIDAVWPFHWLIDLKVALPKDFITKETHPKAFAWVARFDDAVKAAKKSMSKPVTLKGDEAAKVIMSAKAQSAEEDKVDERDPTGLKQGMAVESWPTDTGFRNKDRGKLVKLDRQECVFKNGKGVRVHHPRWNFRVREIKQGEEAKL